MLRHLLVRPRKTEKRGCAQAKTVSKRNMCCWTIRNSTMLRRRIRPGHLKLSPAPSRCSPSCAPIRSASAELVSHSEVLSITQLTRGRLVTWNMNKISWLMCLLKCILGQNHTCNQRGATYSVFQNPCVCYSPHFVRLSNRMCILRLSVLLYSTAFGFSARPRRRVGKPNPPVALRPSRRAPNLAYRHGAGGLQNASAASPVLLIVPSR